MASQFDENEGCRERRHTNGSRLHSVYSDRESGETGEEKLQIRGRFDSVD